MDLTALTIFNLVAAHGGRGLASRVTGRANAALTGAAAAILAWQLVRDDIAAGRLISWGVVPDMSVELLVLHTSRRLVSGKVSAFVEFIRSASQGSLYTCRHLI